MSIQYYEFTDTFTLESGAALQQLQIGYHTFGWLNAAKSNVVWVCHAFTANSDVLDWWKGFVGTGCCIDPEDWYIVCANVLSSPYGTTNPLSINPATQAPYYLDFPAVSVRDMVKAHQLLAAHLQIAQIALLIGGSLGGQQCLEWSVTEPERIKQQVLIATNACHSPWGIASNESQRLAISADATFYNRVPEGGSAGLKAARSMALLQYRGYEAYNQTQQDTRDNLMDNYRASSYQNYQGDKLVKRFNAYSYWYLSKAVDSHHAGRNRGGLEAALQQIKARTLVIGITSDLLFPVGEQKYLQQHIPNAVYAEFDSAYGHDGFLIETGILTNLIHNFLKPAAGGQPAPLHHTIHE